MSDTSILEATVRANTAEEVLLLSTHYLALALHVLQQHATSPDVLTHATAAMQEMQTDLDWQRQNTP